MAGRRHPSTAPGHLPPKEESKQEHFIRLNWYFHCWKAAAWTSPARGAHLKQTYFRHRATVHIFRRCFWGRILSVWRRDHKGCSSKSLHQAALQEPEQHGAHCHGAVERLQPAVGQVAQDVQAVLGEQAHKLRLVVDQGVGHGILQVLVLLSRIKTGCVGGWWAEHLRVCPHPMCFPLLPTLHWMSPLKSSLLAMSTLFHVTASFNSSLYGLASTDARCLLATHTRGRQSQHALSDYHADGVKNGFNLPPTRALSRTVSKSLGPSCSPW